MMINTYTGNRILLKITGSIACVKSTSLIATLRKKGCEVRVACTENTFQFLGKTTLESLSGNKVYSDIFADDQKYNHIEWSLWADLTIVCPATANTLSKLAHGIADNAVTNLFLTHELGKKPYLIAPAMNGKMFDHPCVQHSIKLLKNYGCLFIPPENGRLACGEISNGRLANEETILEAIQSALNPPMKNGPYPTLKKPHETKLNGEKI